MNRNQCNGDVALNGTVSPNLDTGVGLQNTSKTLGIRHNNNNNNMGDTVKIAGDVEEALRDRDMWEQKAKKLQKIIDVNGNSCNGQSSENEQEKLHIQEQEIEIEGLKSKLQTAQQRIRQLENLQQAEAHKDGEIGFLKHQLQEAQDRCKRLEGMCSEKDKRIQELEISISKLQQQQNNSRNNGQLGANCGTPSSRQSESRKGSFRNYVIFSPSGT